MKVELSDPFVASASVPPGGKRLEVFDAHRRADGLMLQISAAGVKVWVVRYRTKDGRQRRFEIGRYPNLSLAKARLEASKVRNDARGGGDPAGDKRREAAEARAQTLRTMADLGTAYFLACENGEWKPRGKKKRASTLAEERAVWRRHVKPTLDSLAIEDVTVATIKKPLRALVAAGHGTTANRVRSLIRQALNFAIHEGRIDRNPVDKIEALGTEQARERVLSDAELKAIWSALINPTDLRRPVEGEPDGKRVYVGAPVSIALRLLLLTLTRRAEVAGMRRDELDLDQSTWTLPSERTKNGRSLLVPLSPAAVRLIREALALDHRHHNALPTPFVFPSPRNRERSITAASLSHAVRDLRLALGMSDVRTHDLRRSAASLMVSERLGITPFIVGRILNHTTETGGAAAVTLRHYALHDFAKDKRSALQAWAHLLTEIVGGGAVASNVRPFRGEAVA